MNLRIITKEREVLSTETTAVTLPGECGRMQILPGHAKLVAKLLGGDVLYKRGDKTETTAISGGIAEVNQDNITLLIK